MKKQVAKSKIFNRESLTELQDKMRTCCIKSYNKYYEKNSILKQKQKGRNQDIKVKDMEDYREIKNQIAKKEQKLQEANNQTIKLDTTSNEINEILDNLKPSKLNKNNMFISSENVKIIKNYTKDIKDTTKTIRNVNDLNMAIRDFEHSAFEVQQENNSLKYELEIKDEEYRTTNINMAKYLNIMFAEAKLMESPLELQNQVALYLFNSIKLEK